MIFWDTSAILPLIVEEKRSPRQTEIYEESGEIFIWTLTPVEVVSALARLVREKRLSAADFDPSIRNFHELSQSWRLIKDVDLVKARALRLWPRHSLRAADAMQLAAALVACADHPAGHRFVTLDDQLIVAAQAEGFDVLY